MCICTKADNGWEKNRNQTAITWAENKAKQSYIRCKIFDIFK